MVQSSVSKVFASRAHTRLGETAMRAQGAASELVGEDYALDRLQQVFLGTRAESVFGGTQQIQRQIVAQRLLGLPRS